MSVQTATVRSHPKTSMGMVEGSNSIGMAGLGSNFKYEEYNSLVSEALEEYALYSAEEAYEDPREKAPMGLMAS